MSLLPRSFLLCGLLLAGCAAVREHQQAVASGRADAALARKAWESPGFLAHHPDIRERKRGFWLDEQGRHAEAAAAFRAAARHADKPAQAMLAEYHLAGRGVVQDPAAAYAWMDLAAERGYPLFLARRERQWQALDPAQRARALRLGRALYAEYGDAVAQPRMAAALQRGRAAMTGSRVGAAGRLTVYLPGDAGWVGIPGTVYYADRYWRSVDYFAWIDAVHGRWPEGAVEVGPLGPAEPPAAQP
jgi:uncharacterized protein